MKHRTIFDIFLIAFAAVILLFPRMLLGQKDSSRIKFSGSSRLYGQYSNRQGTNQQVPSKFWRWDINSTLTVYGIPISTNIFLSSEQSGMRQNVNMFRLNLNPKQLLMRKATERLSKFTRFLAYFSALGIGTNYPLTTFLTCKKTSKIVYYCQTEKKNVSSAYEEG